MKLPSALVFPRSERAAEPSYETAKPVIAGGWVLLACAIVAGAFIAGAAHVRKAPDLAPTRTEDAINMAGVLMTLGKADDALAHCARQMESQPGLAVARNRYANVLISLKRWPEAVDQLTKALEINPADPVALRILAWELATCPEDSVRQGDRAVALAQRANEIQRGKDALTLATLAAAHAETGNFDRALATWQEAFDLVRGKPLAQAIWPHQLHYRAKQPYRGILGIPTSSPVELPEPR